MFEMAKIVEMTDMVELVEIVEMVCSFELGIEGFRVIIIILSFICQNYRDTSN